jgi:hypothetical protein
MELRGTAFGFFNLASGIAHHRPHRRRCPHDRLSRHITAGAAFTIIALTLPALHREMDG